MPVCYPGNSRRISAGINGQSCRDCRRCPFFKGPEYEHPANVLDRFLERAADEVSYQLSGEVWRGYALMIAALFERQLAEWPGARGEEMPRLFRDKLTVAAASVVALDDVGLHFRLELIHAVGNVVRHGDGHSLERPKDSAPESGRGTALQSPGSRRPRQSFSATKRFETSCWR